MLRAFLFIQEYEKKDKLMTKAHKKPAAKE